MFRPTITNLTLISLLRKNQEEKYPWIRVNIGPDIHWFAPGDISTYSILKDSLKATFIREDGTEEVFEGCNFITMQEKPLLLYKNPELHETTDEFGNPRQDVSILIQVIPSLENISLLKPMAEAGFGICLNIGTVSNNCVFQFDFLHDVIDNGPNEITGRVIAAGS